MITEPVTWQFGTDAAVVVHVEGAAFRLDRDPNPISSMDSRQKKFSRALLELALERLDA